MPDRERVIKGLECCLKETKSLDNEPCGECPYGAAGGGCIDQLHAEALVLLKEQESVEPIAIKQERVDEFYGA